MTIEEWIQGKVGFTLTDLNIASILVDRGIVSGTDATLVEVRVRELCWADALTIYVTSSNKGSYQIKDGDSGETYGSEYFVDRDEAKSLAIWLYTKWGEAVPVSITTEIKDVTQMW